MIKNKNELLSWDAEMKISKFPLKNDPYRK